MRPFRAEKNQTASGAMYIAVVLEHLETDFHVALRSKRVGEK